MESQVVNKEFNKLIKQCKLLFVYLLILILVNYLEKLILFIIENTNKLF